MAKRTCSSDGCDRTSVARGWCHKHYMQKRRDGAIPQGGEPGDLLPGEAWRPIPSYEGYYEVSDLGHVRSVDREVVARNGQLRRYRGQVLVPTTASEDRPAVTLYRGAAADHKRVCQLVLAAFVGPCPPGMEACHNNGDCADNRLANLRWDTRSENRRDRLRHGTDHHRNRARCPRNHLLVPPNLVGSSLARGRRACLACARARARQQHAREREFVFDFKAVADQCYAEIMA